MESRSGIVTLLTDFGTDSTYVAAMKGVILTVNPRALVVDASHAVGPQQILEAAYLLETYWHRFPSGTVHVAVVDPGVGTDRPAVALAAGEHLFVGPDNGLFSYQAERVQSAVQLRLGRYSRDVVSATFHGRDLFAPVAGHLSRGEALAALGPRYPAVTVLPEAWPRRHENRLLGRVLHVDQFGNVVTNFDAADAEHAAGVTVGANPLVERHVRTFADASGSEPVWLVGSAGRIEVAIRGSSAAHHLGARTGDEAVLELRPAAARAP